MSGFNFMDEGQMGSALRRNANTGAGQANPRPATGSGTIKVNGIMPGERSPYGGLGRPRFPQPAGDPRFPLPGNNGPLPPKQFPPRPEPGPWGNPPKGMGPGDSINKPDGGFGGFMPTGKGPGGFLPGEPNPYGNPGPWGNPLPPPGPRWGGFDDTMPPRGDNPMPRPEGGPGPMWDPQGQGNPLGLGGGFGPHRNPGPFPPPPPPPRQLPNQLGTWAEGSWNQDPAEAWAAQQRPYSGPPSISLPPDGATLPNENPFQGWGGGSSVNPMRRY